MLIFFKFKILFLNFFKSFFLNFFLSVRILKKQFDGTMKSTRVFQAASSLKISGRFSSGSGDYSDYCPRLSVVLLLIVRTCHVVFFLKMILNCRIFSKLSTATRDNDEKQIYSYGQLYQFIKLKNPRTTLM